MMMMTITDNDDDNYDNDYWLLHLGLTLPLKDWSMSARNRIAFPIAFFSSGVYTWLIRIRMTYHQMVIINGVLYMSIIMSHPMIIKHVWPNFHCTLLLESVILISHYPRYDSIYKNIVKNISLSTMFILIFAFPNLHWRQLLNCWAGYLTTLDPGVILVK